MDNVDVVMSATGGPRRAADADHTDLTSLTDDLFQTYFQRADLDGDGRIDGPEAVSFFQGSALPKHLLVQIWDFTNQGESSHLSREEFYNALKLVTLAQSKRELTPEVVKAALYGPAASKIPAPQINSSPTASGLAADFSSVPSFISSIDNAIMSAGGGEASKVVHSFVSSVDDAVMSASASRASNIVHSFGSSVDDAVMSAGGGRTSDIVPSFVYSVDDAVMSADRGGASNYVRSLVFNHHSYWRGSHGFDSIMDNKIQGFQSFTMAEVVAATNNFSPDNKIGAGNFGGVYKAKFACGREVAIKRKELHGPKTMFYPLKSNISKSDLDLLSSLRNKNMVRLIGLCEEKDERLLVYEYMKNGSLYDHLHDKNNVEKNSSVLNSWKMRIQIALDAARGIEYLHNNRHEVHGDLKSSNILLDASWMARISDFELSSSVGPFHWRKKGGGTIGYIDPEYYVQNVLTEKSDVYAFGVVLLELLTGKKVMFKLGEDSNIPTAATTTTTVVDFHDTISVIDFAMPGIKHGETFEKILDPRVGRPKLKTEVAALISFIGFIAQSCLNSKSHYRPTMSQVVANLEKALESGHFGDVS